MTSLDQEVSIRKSVSLHLRVWKDVFDSLESEAKIHRISVNSLSNQVLSRHTRDEMELGEVGYVEMTKDAYRAMLDLVPDDKLTECGRLTTKPGVEALMVARNGPMTIDSVLDILRLSSRIGWFSLKESRDKGKKTICLLHDLGPRQSAVFAGSMSTLFSLVGIRPKVSTTDSSVMIEY